MDEQKDFQKQLDEQRALLELVYESVEKTRKYFQWTMIGTVVMFVLPLIGIALVIPTLLNTLGGGLL